MSLLRPGLRHRMKLFHSIDVIKVNINDIMASQQTTNTGQVGIIL